MPSVVDCSECIRTYETHKEDPPCDNCEKPELLSKNKDPWTVWVLLNKHDRERYPEFRHIPIASIAQTCSALNLSKEVFERIILIEDVAFQNEFKKMKTELDKRKKPKEKKGRQ